MREIDLRAKLLILRECLKFRAVISCHRLEDLAEFLITELLAQFRHSDLYTGAGSPWDADGDKLT